MLDLRSGPQIMAQIGAQHFKNMLKRDPKLGGRLVLITGYQGTGKTTLLLLLAKLLFNKDYLIWRGRDLAQWHRFPDFQQKVVLFKHRNDDLKIYKIDHITSKTEELDNLKIIEYEEANDIVRKLYKTRMNVIYEPSFYRISDQLAYEIAARTNIFISPEKRKIMKASFFWYELFFRLLRRKDRRWISLFLDEFDDIAPETPKGIQWVLQEWMMHSIKDFRKAFLSVYASTHVLTNVDWRIRSKFQIRIYLQGAQLEKGSIIRKKSIVHQLPLGLAIIEWGTYGMFAFQPLPDPGFDVFVEKKWTGELPDMSMDDVPVERT